MRANDIRQKCLSIVLLFLIGCSGGRVSTLDTTSHTPQVLGDLSPKDLQQLRAADIILIGETHDHPRHHMIQANLIRDLKPKSVAFEMLNESQSIKLIQFQEQAPKDWDQYLEWSKRGWPDFELYRPVFRASLDVGAQLWAAHPNAELLQPLKMGRELPIELQRSLKLDQALPPQEQSDLVKEIQTAHCGHATPLIVKAMVSAQRLKDAWMAKRILEAPKPVILIVGRGHIKLNRGIPWALKQLRSESKDKVQVISLSPTLSSSQTANQGLIELKVKAHRTDDPCERFREQLKRLKNMESNKQSARH